jgi:ArsR family transcriptional regulator, arsenate/arsenite/antimonite-responsive transcriptional repressor
LLSSRRIIVAPFVSMIFDTLILVDISTIVNMRMECCEPLFGGVLEEEGATRTAAMFAALADPVRLRIVSMLAAAPEGTACGCELEDPLGLAQPTVSHHLRILREAGLVVGEKRGRWVHYRVVPERLDEIRDALRPPVLDLV